jgi:hypothetical protein
MDTTGTYIANGPNMPKQPFAPEVMETYADRLVRHALLARHLDDPEHPCMEAEEALLKAAEAPVKASADYCRRAPEWPILRTWFATKVLKIAREKLPSYGFSAPIGHSVLAEIISRGFDHVLENRTGESGVMASPGSNVLSPGKCKTS